MRLYSCVIEIYDISFHVTIADDLVQSLTLAAPEKFFLLLRSAIASTKPRMVLLTTEDVLLDSCQMTTLRLHFQVKMSAAFCLFIVILKPD